MKIAILSDLLTQEEADTYKQSFHQKSPLNTPMIELTVNDLRVLSVPLLIGNGYSFVPECFLHVEALRILSQRAMEKDLLIFA